MIIELTDELQLIPDESTIETCYFGKYLVTRKQNEAHTDASLDKLYFAVSECKKVELVNLLRHKMSSRPTLPVDMILMRRIDDSVNGPKIEILYSGVRPKIIDLTPTMPELGIPQHLITR